MRFRSLFTGFSLCASLVACSAGGAGDEQGDGRNSAPLSGDAERGRELADSSSCTSCHQADYGGAGFFPNVTPDHQLGIGSWTDQQIKNALINGIDDEGEALCSLMERFPFSNQQVADLIAFLRALPPVARQTQSECP